MTKFFGGLLMAIGILIATLSGLCSAFFLVMTLGDTNGAQFGDAPMLLMIAVIGGLPFMSGVGLFFWGRWLLRLAREREAGEGAGSDGGGNDGERP
ncbi:MAG: hypothetical protein ABIS51_05405 [Sphingomonas sp.]